MTTSKALAEALALGRGFRFRLAGGCVMRVHHDQFHVPLVQRRHLGFQPQPDEVFLEPPTRLLPDALFLDLDRDPVQVTQTREDL